MRILFLLFLAACSLNLPAKLREDFKSPRQVEKNGKQIIIYIEQNGDNYTVLGIHALSGREFLIKVDNGKITKEEYGFIFSRGEVREILKEVLN